MNMEVVFGASSGLSEPGIEKKERPGILLVKATPHDPHETMFLHNPVANYAS
jgi:hypothetical protein